MEEWKDIPDTNGTMQVSNLGRVRSRRGANGLPLPAGEWRMCKLSDHRKGYLQVQVTYPDGKQLRLVHDIVLEAFVGPAPPGQIARHDPDPTKTNNALTNLKWGTPSQNNQDTARHGRMARQQLTADDVWGVKLLLRLGNETPLIRQVYPKATSNRISAIRNDYNWSHVEWPVIPE